MSPETIVMIGGRKVVVDDYRWGKEVVIIPQVIMGESATKNLGALLAGRAWVNYDPSANYQKVTLMSGVDTREAINQIIVFLQANDSLWRLAK